MSPEFKTFIGFPMRHMRPCLESNNKAEQIVRRRLPNWTQYDLFSRRDLPFQQNAMMGKRLYDMNMHGFEVPYPYLMFKQLKKAFRNDRKLKQNKFKVLVTSGAKNPPANWSPIPDTTESEDD